MPEGAAERRPLQKNRVEGIGAPRRYWMARRVQSRPCGLSGTP